MLVLSRKVGEKIRIGADITITVVRIAGQVRIGIEAPKEVPVHRLEVIEQMKEEAHDRDNRTDSAAPAASAPAAADTPSGETGRPAAG